MSSSERRKSDESETSSGRSIMSAVPQPGGPAATPRVLQVVLGLDPGGTERLVIELASRLHAEIPMAVCCLDDEGAWSHELTSRGIDVTALRRRPGFRPLLGRAIARAAGRHRATIVHAHHYSPFVYSCLARIWRPSLRVVFTEHGRLADTPASPKRQLANRFLSAFPRTVAAVSKHLREHLIVEGFDPAAVGVIYNGIDIGSSPDGAARRRAREILQLDQDVFAIGTVARLDPVKDLGTLIRACRDLADTPRSLIVVIGDGPERERLQQLAVDLDVAPRVRFLGHRDDARQLLAGCDAYVNCSISEGISLTILEAMAACLPIVATEVGGTPEILDGSCGRLVPARTPRALTAELQNLARDAALRAQIGNAARQRVEERFSLDRMIGLYRSVYLEAAG